MSHPLDGAYLRLNRAGQHLAEAERLLSGWEQGCIDNVFRQDDGQFRFNGFPDVPDMLPVIVGDVAHNLRAALDYLVYELSKLDSQGRITDGTQFLIESIKSDPANTLRGFDGRSRRYLKGLSQAHIDALEALQPYRGVEWTEVLRDISNPDKHRHLTILTKAGRRVEATIQRHPEGRFRLPDRFDLKEMKFVADRFDIEVSGLQTIAVTLPQRGEVPVIPSLRRIEAKVAGTLDGFRPDF